MPFCLAKPQWLQRYVAAQDRKFRADGAFSLDGFFYRFAPAALCAHEGDAFTLASCFRWRGKFVTASVLSNRTGKPLPCHKLPAIHVHRRIVATTSCGKYLSRLFISIHLPQLLYVDTISVIQYSIAQVELGFVAPTLFILVRFFLSE